MEILPVPHHEDVFRLWFSPSGRRLMTLTGHAGGANRLWNWDVPGWKPIAGRKVVTDREHRNCYPFPAFDRTLRYMAVGRRVVDRRTRRRIRQGFVQYDWVFSPDARTLFVIDDSARGTRIKRFDLSWEFEGRSTAIESNEDRLLVWPEKEYISDLAVRPDGDLLVGRNSDGNKLLPFRLTDGVPLPAVVLPVYETDGEEMTMEPYGRTLFAPDGRTVAVAGNGVVLADPLGSHPVRVLDERHFSDLAFTPDGTRLVGVRPDGKAVVWDTASGAVAASFDFEAEVRSLRAVAVAPDGMTAVAGGPTGQLVRWDI